MAYSFKPMHGVWIVLVILLLILVFTLRMNQPISESPDRVQGILQESKDGAVVNNVFLPTLTEEQIEQYRGKQVEVVGETVVAPADCPEPSPDGAVSACRDTERTEMRTITSIKVISE